VTLEQELIERIERSGPMPFAAYMALALYDPKHGYYAAGATRTGWRGHFLTSPELDPAFGELWARGFEQIWVATGRPDEFHVVEIGPAEGGFARAVLRASTGSFGERLRYHLVERVPAVADRQRDALAGDHRARWHASIVDLPFLGAGCVFANEVLDNLPVHLVRRDPDGLMELCLEVSAGGLTLAARPPSNPELEFFLQRVSVDLPPGHVYEVGLAAESLVARAARVIDSGALVFVDYGAEADELALRPSGSLLCYSDKGVDADPLERPGDKDITVHANWSAVRAALQGSDLNSIGPLSQRNALLSLGARELDERLKVAHSQAIAERKGAESIALLSRRQSLGALLDPGGLGGLQVQAGISSGIEIPFLSAS
jgi:SAM-dependent MidA family methyltransferase